MVSFKFRTSKTVNFATDVLSKHGFHLNDLNRICVYLHYYDMVSLLKMLVKL